MIKMRYNEREFFGFGGDRMGTKKEKQLPGRSLVGKTVAITGSTGGLGHALVRRLAELGANLLLLDRNRERSEAFRRELLKDYPTALIRCLSVDLADPQSVFLLSERLKEETIDIFIQNAGAYSIPRCKTAAGYDNVFQINFVSPYYLIRRLLPQLRERRGRVVVVGSIAHNYSRTDPQDVDFSERKQASKVYGNAKRYLMFSMYSLFAKESRLSLAVAHPGITFTNITAHYPKWIYAIIKYPMKILFMKPAKACQSILRGVFEDCLPGEWIGPRIFDVWGAPKKRRLRTVQPEEAEAIAFAAEETYRSMCRLQGTWNEKNSYDGK